MIIKKKETHNKILFQSSWMFQSRITITEMLSYVPSLIATLMSLNEMS